MPIDPGIELLPDVPIAGPADDLLGHAPLAERLVELACASPAATPRVIGLVGTAGVGKTSVLHLAGLLLAERPEVATVAIDAGDHGTADATLAAMTATIHEVFKSGGVVEAADAARDALARYGEVVSTAVRLAGVKVDVAGAVQRSAASARAELVENAQQLGKRVVIVIDHLDRLVDRELAAAVGALRVFAQIPYLGFIVAYDRRALASRALDPAALARLIHVEMAVPAVDRVLLARLVAGGLARAAERLGRTIDPILPLLDPDATTGLGLALCETPRDGKRLVNTLAAVLPLLSDADLRRAALDAAVRLVAPILDGPRLAPVPLQQRAERTAELRARIAAHPLAAPLGAAIDALVAS